MLDQSNLPPYLSRDLLIKDLVDVFFSHNCRVALWCEHKLDRHYSKLLWKGMAHSIPEEFSNTRFVKFFGTIPESIWEADILNIEVRVEDVSV